MIVKVGVIGIGTVSQLMHLPILSGLHEQYQITAVSDISPTQLAFIAKKYNATPYTDPYELVKDPNVDAVFVCSPDQYHAAYALAAMEAGKHVFVEKPVTLCMEDLEKLIAAEKAHPELVCMVGYMRRYGNGFLKCKELLQASATLFWRATFSWDRPVCPICPATFPSLPRRRADVCAGNRWDVLWAKAARNSSALPM